VRPVTHLRVFLSSPGDVAEERALVRTIVEQELAKERMFRLGAHLEVVSWDDPNAPVPLDARLTPQAAIDRGIPLPSQCDIVVVVLWSRIGTPFTHDGKQYQSGTEYEYLEALASKIAGRPEILVYRRTSPIEDAWRKRLIEETDDQRVAQRDKVTSFFARFSDQAGLPTGGFKSYKSPLEFKEKTKLELRELLRNL
jgi:hypothetical protein